MLYRRRHNRRGDTVGLCFVIMMCQQRMSFRSGRILHGDPSDMRGRIPVRNDKRRFIVRINLLRRCHCGSAVERRFRKPLVGGSIPSSGSSSNIIIGRDPSVCEGPISEKSKEPRIGAGGEPPAMCQIPQSQSNFFCSGFGLRTSSSFIRYWLTILMAHTSPHMEHPSCFSVHPLAL